jgi:DNA-3-methyladenine glycosylase
LSTRLNSRPRTARACTDALLDVSRALPRALLADARAAGPALLGCILVREHRGVRRAGVIVETEAYFQEEPACHAFRGRTRRNATLFGRAGLAYVYRIHRSFCVNVVTGPEGRGEAVLVRELEPLDGVQAMERARRRATVGATAPQGAVLTNGPGRLCQAMGIDLALDGADLLARPAAGRRLYLLAHAYEPRIGVSPRIGISQARDLPLRFFVQDNEWVSRRLET